MKSAATLFSPACSLLAFCLVFLAVCSAPSFSYGKANVAGQFVSARGNTIVLQLSVQSDQPLTIIVEQMFADGNTIIATVPSAKKIAPNGKKIKWLLKKIRSGSISLRTKLETPLQGKVQAVIRYRSPQDGRFMETKVSS